MAAPTKPRREEAPCQLGAVHTWHIKAGYGEFHRGGQNLGKADNGDERDKEETDAQNSSSASRRRRVRLFIVTFDREEVVAVPHGLNENERTVQHQRYNPGEDKLRRAVQRAECACRVAWKNERKTGERCQHGERRARSLDLKSLFVMAGTAHE